MIEANVSSYNLRKNADQYVITKSTECDIYERKIQQPALNTFFHKRIEPDELENDKWDYNFCKGRLFHINEGKFRPKVPHQEKQKWF